MDRQRLAAAAKAANPNPSSRAGGAGGGGALGGGAPAPLGDVADRLIFGSGEDAGGRRRPSRAQQLWALLRHKVMTDKLFVVGMKQAKLRAEYAEMHRAKKSVKLAKETEKSLAEKEGVQLTAVETEETIKEQMLEQQIKVLEAEQRRLQAARELSLLHREAKRLQAVSRVLWEDAAAMRGGARASLPPGSLPLSPLHDSAPLLSLRSPPKQRR